MMNRFFPVLFAFVLALCVASPVFADDVAASSSDASSVPAASSSSVPAASSSVPAVEFDGADSVVGDANNMIDSVYDNMPVQDSGVLGFMAGVTSAIPLEFVYVIVLSLILSVVLLLFKFLWKLRCAMSDFVWLLDFARKCLSVPIVVWGFTISMWSIIVFSLFASVILWFIGEIVSGQFGGGGE